MGYAREDMKRVIVVLPPEEHTAFDQAAQFAGQPKLTMSVVARELFRQFAAGKIPVDRERAKRNAKVANRASPDPRGEKRRK